MSGVRGDARKRLQESQPAPEVGLTEAALTPGEREDLGQRLMLTMTCAHGADCFGQGAVCETCFANVQRIGRIVERIVERTSTHIKADAIQQERAARERLVDDIKKCWAVDMRAAQQQREARLTLVAKVEALADEWESPSRPTVSGWQKHAAKHLRALLSSDATATLLDDGSGS